ncbi:TPA: hypothetical protein EYP66_23400 [Candidatus Poribacteria bacterium]|nr:hypothetical protein [Candidatus Poribacteria bacterium]
MTIKIEVIPWSDIFTRRAFNGIKLPRIWPLDDLEYSELPEDYGNVDYPNIGFRKDEVLIIYSWNRPVPERVGRMKLRIYPVEWFYR